MINFEKFKSGSGKVWCDYVQHDFVMQLANGTLPLANFKYYLCQDYVFLMKYAKAWGYAVYKSRTQSELDFAGKYLSGLLTGEIDLHLAYCEKWGISKDEAFDTEPHKNNTLYTSYVLECGRKGGFMDMITALAPCTMGYAEIGKYILKSQDKLNDNNPYQSWIDTYVGEEFQQYGETFKEFMNGLYVGIDTETEKQQQHIFNRATELEVAFWDISMENFWENH